MESNVLETIVSNIITYKEDNPHVIITSEMIKQIVESNIEEITKEIEKEVEQY